MGEGEVMTKDEVREQLKAWSEEYDKVWHESWNDGHDGHYRDLLDGFMVRIDEMEFKLRKPWWKK
jgi:hypothetical protein